MNRKITPAQAVHIRSLINEQHMKLREVAVFYPISLAQIHRIAQGENWQSVTGATAPSSTGSPALTDTKR